MPQRVEWTDDLSVGIEKIDEQHKMLITKLNDLTEALSKFLGSAKISSTLNFLIEYTHFHFSAEEGFMEESGFPTLEQHKLKHAEFIDTLKNIEREFVEEGATEMLAVDIDTLLINWLLGHIRGVDVGFGKYLNENDLSVS